MPTKIKIPAKTEYICEPCVHHRESSKGRAFDGRWVHYSCMHPDASNHIKEPATGETEMFTARFLRLVSLNKEGRDIGKTGLQPDWCPLNRKNK